MLSMLIELAGQPWNVARQLLDDYLAIHFPTATYIKQVQRWICESTSTVGARVVGRAPYLSAATQPPQADLFTGNTQALTCLQLYLAETHL